MYKVQDMYVQYQWKLIVIYFECKESHNYKNRIWIFNVSEEKYIIFRINSYNMLEIWCKQTPSKILCLKSIK